MKRTAMVMVVAALVTSPVQGAEWNDVRPGAFVGARVRLPLGGSTATPPRASLTIAPTQNRVFHDGSTVMRIGEGIALDFGAGRTPTLSLAGVRADEAMGLTSGPTTDHRTKSGMSDGAKVAVGVGVALVLVAGGTYFYLANRCTECDQ